MSYNRNPYPNKKQRTNKTKKSQWIIGQTDTHFSENIFIKKVWLLIKQDQEDSIEKKIHHDELMRERKSVHSAFDTQLQQKQFRQEFHLLMGLFISNN